jgi:UDP-glucuronate 4-epimerase
MNKILVTGAAGFIGYHLSKRLSSAGFQVIGIDNLNSYYAIQLKKDRLAELKHFSNFEFIHQDIVDQTALLQLCQQEKFSYVIHLAAQAGVRYSIENPQSYIDSNLIGFFNILEACRQYPVKHLIYASSSSVYGGNKKLPFSEQDSVDHPFSLYAATKKSNELLAHSYAHLYQIPCTGLRFFTVYGPYGRPDMAMYQFTKAIIEGAPIKLFSHGKHLRDFTYIDDIIDGITALLDCAPTNVDNAETQAPWKIYNIGNENPVTLMEYVHLIEKHVGKKAILELHPPQPGDMPNTHADMTALNERIGFKPIISLDEGIERFVQWYKTYYA